MKCRLLTRWPKSKPTWGCLPEHEGITLTRAREVVRQQAHWQPCGLHQRITTKAGRVVSTHRSRLASPKRRAEICRIHLPEVAL
jgi:hypothetical protein